MIHVAPPEVVTVTLSSLARRHPVFDASVALIAFLVALSVIGSAIWLARKASRG
jgi:hypothetical protein